jgi:hypothetical protein
METGEDLITERSVGDFKGQACYYFVRRFRSVGKTGAFNIMIGRTGPYRAWLDGQLIGQSDDIRGWAAHEYEGLACTLTGREQRLVVKFICLADVFSLSLNFVIPWVDGCKHGVSYILDTLEDYPSVQNRQTDKIKNIGILSNTIGKDITRSALNV